MQLASKVSLGPLKVIKLATKKSRKNSDITFNLKTYSGTIKKT